LQPSVPVYETRSVAQIQITSAEMWLEVFDLPTLFYFFLDNNLPDT